VGVDWLDVVVIPRKNHQNLSKNSCGEGRNLDKGKKERDFGLNLITTSQEVSSNRPVMKDKE